MESAASAEAEHRLTDPASWREQYGTFMLRYAFRHVGDWHKAQDLVQETWLAAWQVRDRFAGRSTERTWLIGILRHKILSHFRVASREQPLSEMENDQLHETGKLNSHTWPAPRPMLWMDPASQLERKQLLTRLDQCLCKLTDRMKAVFAFCDLDELPHRDVARRLGVTDGHLYVLLHRARKRIKQCLTGHNTDGQHLVSTAPEKLPYKGAQLH